MADYDEVLPERATVPCKTCNMTADGVHKITPAPAYWQCPDCGGVRFRPARAGDTIEVPCHWCGSIEQGRVNVSPVRSIPCPARRHPKRVLLAEDPTPTFQVCDFDDDAKQQPRGWRHRGEVVSDG